MSLLSGHLDSPGFLLGEKSDFLLTDSELSLVDLQVSSGSVSSSLESPKSVSSLVSRSPRSVTSVDGVISGSDIGTSA